MKKCKECKQDSLKNLGLGEYGDTIHVECQNSYCLNFNESYEIKTIEGSLEWVEAMKIDEGVK